MNIKYISFVVGIIGSIITMLAGNIVASLFALAYSVSVLSWRNY